MAETRSELDWVGEVVPFEAGCREVVMFDRLGEFGLEVLVERSAQRHVDDLEPSTEAQDWLAISEGPPGQLKLDRIAVGIDVPEPGVGWLAEVDRIHVDPAR